MHHFMLPNLLKLLDFLALVIHVKSTPSDIVLDLQKRLV